MGGSDAALGTIVSSIERLLRGTVFTDCRFEDCRFWAQHTYMGGPSTFERCVFSRCQFENVQFWETRFNDCEFSGKFVNIVFYGPNGPKDWRTEFHKVDLSGVTMEDVDFRLGIKLSTVTLP